MTGKLIVVWEHAVWLLILGPMLVAVAPEFRNSQTQTQTEAKPGRKWIKGPKTQTTCSKLSGACMHACMCICARVHVSPFLCSLTCALVSARCQLYHHSVWNSKFFLWSSTRSCSEILGIKLPHWEGTQSQPASTSHKKNQARIKFCHCVERNKLYWICHQSLAQLSSVINSNFNVQSSQLEKCANLLRYTAFATCAKYSPGQKVTVLWKETMAIKL